MDNILKRTTYWFAFVSLVAVSLVLSSCRQQPGEKVQTTAVAQPSLVARDSSTGKPQIFFTDVVHDFGEIGPETSHNHEFEFFNIGEGLLKITKIDTPCGCTVAKLTQREYAPAQQGSLNVTFTSDSRGGDITRPIYVHTNDSNNPKVTLTVKARVVKRIVFEPKQLNLLPKLENAGCPEITLRSLDEKPFKITRLISTGNLITADFENLPEAARQTISPRVDVENLKAGYTGTLNVITTHPEDRKVSIPFRVLPEFTLDMPWTTLWTPEPLKPLTEQALITNNYKQPFEIESVSSANGYIKMLSSEKVNTYTYNITLQLTPPALQDGKWAFADVLRVKTSTGQTIGAPVRGFYSR